MRAAGIPDVASYVFDHEAPSPWTGPVVRLADLTVEQRVAIGECPDAARYRSVHETWRCTNCRSWTMHGAFKFGRCNFCLTPRSPPA